MKTLLEYKFWSLAISSLSAAASIISLTQRVLRIGLQPLLSDALSFYRTVEHVLVHPIEPFLPIRPTGVYLDLFLASAILLSTYIRSLYATYVIGSNDESHNDISVNTTDLEAIFIFVFVLACVAIAAMCLVGLFVPLFVSYRYARESIVRFDVKYGRTFKVQRYQKINYTDASILFWTYLRILSLATAAAIIFYVFNSSLN